MEGRQIEPKYYGYKGGYDHIFKCPNCSATGLYEDFSCGADPCPYCGSTLSPARVAKWIPPIYEGFLWKRKKMRGGYWLLKGGD